MTVQEGPGGLRTKILLTDYPFVEGNELGTTKIEGRQINLVPEGVLGQTNTILQEDRKGL